MLRREWFLIFARDLIRCCLCRPTSLTDAVGTCTESDVLAVERRPESWMRGIRELTCANFTQRRLVDIAIVGSHDAASWWLSKRAANCGPKCTICEMNDYYVALSKRWGVAHGLNLSMQLKAGTRYFDLRLTVDRNERTCKRKETVTESCWKSWHCLLGVPLADIVKEIRQFMIEDERDPARQSEVVIINAKLEHFHGNSLHRDARENDAMTEARLVALFKHMEQELGEFIFDGPGEWWMLPLQDIMSSGKRLIVVVTGLKLSAFNLALDALASFSARHRFRYVARLSGKEAANDAPFWGSYSDTCCRVRRLAKKQGQKQRQYNDMFIHEPTFGSALRERGPRPLFQLYWTMTYSPKKSLSTDSGDVLNSLKSAAALANSAFVDFFNSKQSIPVFANIIMSDWIDMSTTHLRVALSFTIRGPPVGGTSGLPQPLPTHVHWQTLFALGFAFVLILLFAVALLRQRAQVRSRNQQSPPMRELAQFQSKSTSPQRLTTNGIARLHDSSMIGLETSWENESRISSVGLRASTVSESVRGSAHYPGALTALPHGTHLVPGTW
eukprot:TRINITY_DN42270_c0_g1_i1.p1 TRINITY_DN42270_c0_g1~~TRINITY_DN42270_c0_g1_i1.p1  ORF type:complete len:557 (+),score=24.00 TRINITY_DN42270_c0_g1_i1:48-1718(+)